MDYIVKNIYLKCIKLNEIFNYMNKNIHEQINKIFPDFIKLPISIFLIASISCI